VLELPGGRLGRGFDPPVHVYRLSNFECKFVLIFNPWAKLQTIRHLLTTSSFRLIPTVPVELLSRSECTYKNRPIRLPCCYSCTTFLFSAWSKRSIHKVGVSFWYNAVYFQRLAGAFEYNSRWQSQAACGIFSRERSNSSIVSIRRSSNSFSAGPIHYGLLPRGIEEWPLFSQLDVSCLWIYS